MRATLDAPFTYTLPTPLPLTTLPLLRILRHTHAAPRTRTCLCLLHTTPVVRTFGTSPHTPHAFTHTLLHTACCLHFSPTFYYTTYLPCPLPACTYHLCHTHLPALPPACLCLHTPTITTHHHHHPAPPPFLLPPPPPPPFPHPSISVGQWKTGKAGGQDCSCLCCSCVHAHFATRLHTFYLPALLPPLFCLRAIPTKVCVTLLLLPLVHLPCLCMHGSTMHAFDFSLA